MGSILSTVLNNNVDVIEQLVTEILTQPLRVRFPIIFVIQCCPNLSESSLPQPAWPHTRTGATAQPTLLVTGGNDSIEQTGHVRFEGLGDFVVG